MSARAEPVDAEPVFERDHEMVVPTTRARGPWGEIMNGRNLSGLVAWAVERDHGDVAYQPARLTVDMFRAAPLVPLRVTTTMVRRGHRVRVVDASVRDGEGLELARGAVVQLRKGESPPGRVWVAPEWDRPAPESLPAVPRREEDRLPWDLRGVGRNAWIRELRPFVSGDPLTPFVRAALAADATNGAANSSLGGLGYINADLTLYLARLPAGEWVGLEATGHGSDLGVAFGTASVYDVSGRIGHVAMSAVADTRLLVK